MAKAPSIRLKNFSDEWNLYNLDEKVKFYNGLTYTPADVVEQDGTLVLRSSNVQSGEIVSADNVYVNSDVVNTDNVEIGDIIVVVRNGSKALLGKHAEVKNEMPNTVIGAFMTGIRTQNPPFVNALLSTPAFNEELRINMGATINQITGGMFKSMEFYFPKDDEQKKIGKVFDSLDNVIAFHQKKLNKLYLTKKSMLLKMFPKSGEDIPEIRFKEFSGNWEWHKLGDFFTKYQNTVYLKDEESYRQVSIRNNGTVEYRGTKKGVEIGRKRQYIVDTVNHPNTLTFTRQTIFEGGIGFVPAELNGAIVTENMPLLSMHNMDKRFMVALTQSEEYYAHAINEHTLVGSAQKALHENQWLDSNVLIPSLPEQKKIGVFFENLDNLISLQEAKIKKLKNTKKALLKKMFV